MEKQWVLSEMRDGAGYITFNHPEKLNAFSKPLVEALTGKLEEMWFHPDVRVIVLRGAGNTFSAGGDLVTMKRRIDLARQGLPPESNSRENLRRLNRLASMIRSINKPVVAWVEGAAAGGGLGVAMACDFALAEHDCKMSFAFTGIGLAPDMGATTFLASRVGVPRATELLMLGTRFSGREAADWGIITSAWPSDELEEQILALVRKLSTGPTQAYAAVKASVNETVYSGLDHAMNREVEAQVRLAETYDHAEAIDAFMEKRKPAFRGL